MVAVSLKLNTKKLLTKLNNNNLKTKTTIGWDNKPRRSANLSNFRKKDKFGNARAVKSSNSSISNADVGYYLLKKGFNFHKLFLSKSFWNKSNFTSIKNYFTNTKSENKNKLSTIGINMMRNSILKYSGKQDQYNTIKNKRSNKTLLDTHQFINNVKNMSGK